MHTHDHSKDDSSQRIGLVFFLNLGFTIIEFIGGWVTNSTAIMAAIPRILEGLASAVGRDIVYWQQTAMNFGRVDQA